MEAVWFKSDHLGNGPLGDLPVVVCISLCRHALIFFLALVLHRVKRMRLQAAGVGQTPTAVLGLLATIQRHQVKLGGQTLRGLNAPTSQQLEIFAALDARSPPTH